MRADMVCTEQPAVSPHEIKEELAQIRALVGNKPFGVDLVLPPGMPSHNSREAIEADIPQEHKDFVKQLTDRYQVPEASGPGMRTRFIRSTEIEQEQLRVIMESDVDMMACGIGAPPDVIAEAKDRGKTTLALIGSPHHVPRSLQAGVDIIVAQGYDAGAHTGPIGTYSLVPQIVDAAGEVPVLVAGGVATGRHIAAALAMGGQGVWLGTAWLLSTEHQAHMHPVNTAKLKEAGSADTVITRSESGKPFRQVRTGWSQAWEADDAPKTAENAHARRVGRRPIRRHRRTRHRTPHTLRRRTEHRILRRSAARGRDNEQPSQRSHDRVAASTTIFARKRPEVGHHKTRQRLCKQQK
jgi:NAD(P)H-dependent flavin oxidoreductase YrpB (nitropropane dioxygenase family)